MCDKTKVFDDLQLILNDLRNDLEKKGLKLESLSESEVATLISQYVPNELIQSSIQLISEDSSFSLEPIYATLPCDHQDLDLLERLLINPNNLKSIIKTLPMTAYYLGRVFQYGQPEEITEPLSENDLYQTSLLKTPVLNLIGIARLETMLSHLQSQDFTVLLNGVYGVITTAPSFDEVGEISFAANVTLRLNKLIDGHRICIKLVAASKPYNYELYESNDFNIEISGINQLEFIAIKENDLGFVEDVLKIEQFIMSGFFGEINPELCLYTADRQVKIAQTFIMDVQQAINDKYAEIAKNSLNNYFSSLISHKKTEPVPLRKQAPTKHLDFDATTSNTLPS